MTKQNVEGGVIPAPSIRKPYKPILSGVYVIYSNVSGKRYVGSSVNISKRLRMHRRALDNGRHYAVHLQRAWDKYGADSFTFGILVICERQELINWEQFFIDFYRAADMNFGYNTRPYAEGWLGYKPTPEAIEKQAKFAVGNEGRCPRRPNAR